MSDQTDDSDPERPKRIAELAGEIADNFSDQQSDLARETQEAGYMESVFRGVESTYAGGQVPDEPALAGTEVSLRLFLDVSKMRGRKIKSLVTNVSTSAYTVAVTASVSAGIVIANIRAASSDVQKTLTWPVQLSTPPQPPNWTRERFESYATKLTRLDPELGNVYRSVWQKFHGGTDDPYRAALGAMRQSFDHLLRILAPDGDVRNSPYFTRKKGEKPNQVHRPERLRFAANKFITDPAQRAFVESQVNSVLENYERLNKLHDSAPLDATFVTQALCAMQGAIQQWMDAVEPSFPLAAS